MAAEELDEAEGLERPEERGTGPAGFVRRLLRERRRSRVPPPVRRVPADPDPSARRMAWAAELLKRESVRFLVHQGGWRKRQVVVGDRRREGRVWDPGVWERLQVGFGPAALLLLEAAMKTDPEALPAVPPALEEASLGCGDLFALHLVVEPLLQSAGTGRRSTRSLSGASTRREAEALRAPLEALLRAFGAAGRWGGVVRDDGALVVQAGDAQYATTPEVARGVVERAGTTPHVWSEGGNWVQRLRLIVRRWPAQGLALLVAVPLARTRAGLDLEAPSIREALDALEGALPGSRPGGDGTREQRGQALLRASPLTLLFRPQELGALDPAGEKGCDAALRALAPLFQGDRPALLTWLDEALARAWLREEERRQGLPPAAVGQAWQAAGRGLLALAAAAEARPDALRPLIRFYDLFLVRFGTRAPVIQAVQARAEALDRASDRDALRHAAALLFAPGRAITAAGERALGRAFVDRSEPERAFLVEYHEGWRQIGPEIEAIRRELAGEVG